MKISNSKKELAKIISENGGWRDGAEFSAQDKADGLLKNAIHFYDQKPSGRCGESWSSDGFMGYPFSIKREELSSNWHQAILSRAEYFHLYPAPDGDGWIEWKGGECPVDEGSVVEARQCNGLTYKAMAANFHWNLITGSSCVVAYRLHKPEKAKSTVVGDDDTNLAAKEELEAIELSESALVRANLSKIYAPSIESLAADYRNKLDYADRKRDEADKAKVGSDAALSELERAVAAIGFNITPIGAVAKEPELVITDWRNLQVGDEIEYVEGSLYYMVGVTGVVVDFDGNHPKAQVRMASEFISKNHEAWPRKWRFINRPAK